MRGWRYEARGGRLAWHCHGISAKEERNGYPLEDNVNSLSRRCRHHSANTGRWMGKVTVIGFCCLVQLVKLHSWNVGSAYINAYNEWAVTPKEYTTRETPREPREINTTTKKPTSARYSTQEFCL